MSEEWVSGDGVKIDPEMDGKVVTALESVSSVWKMTDSDSGEQFAVPMLIMTFYVRDHEAHTVVLPMGGCASLMSDISDHFVRVCGGVGPISGEMTEAGLQRMLDEVMGEGKGEL